VLDGFLGTDIKMKHYTYAEYMTWNGDVRYELIDGVPCALASPSTIHQRVSRELTLNIGNYLKGKSCELFVAPYDVRLNVDTGDDTVVQPDLFVVCDKSKLDGQACLGAPDLVIEILSPSTARFDMLIKFQKYMKAGVREYWIVDPESKTVNAFILENNKYVSYIYAEEDTITSQVLDGCSVKLADVFE